MPAEEVPRSAAAYREYYATRVLLDVAVHPEWRKYWPSYALRVRRWL